MHDTAEIKKLLQSAVDALYIAEKYEEEAMALAQRTALEGEKRRLRHQSVKTHKWLNKFITNSYDVLGIQLIRTHNAATLPESITPKGFFEMYLAKLTGQHEKLHTIANKLVAMNYYHGAKCLYRYCECIIQDIKEYRRTIIEGNACNWDMAFIMYRNNTHESTHDKYEKKEKKS